MLPAIAALSISILKKYASSFAIPPHNMTQNRSTIIRFDGRWCSKVTPVIRHSATQYDAKSRHHHSFCWAMVQGNYPHHPPFHRAMQHETAAPSFVLMGDGAAKLPPSSVIPPRNTTRNRSAIIRFDGDGARKLPPCGLYFREGRVDERSEIYPV